MRYEIRSRQGDVLGVYEGETEIEALDALARDAGCRDHAHAVAVQYGDDLWLHDYATGEEVRHATEAEVAESIRAGYRDGGRGVIDVPATGGGWRTRRGYVVVDATGGLRATPVTEPRDASLRVRLTGEQRAALGRIAADDGATVSEVVRRLVADAIRARIA